MYVKIFNKENQNLVAVCDKDILGKKFEQGKLRLEVTSEFYKGNLMNIKDAIKILHKANIANLTGENIINAVIKQGLADPEAIIRISGTPHLQFMKI